MLSLWGQRSRVVPGDDAEPHLLFSEMPSWSPSERPRSWGPPPAGPLILSKRTGEIASLCLLWPLGPPTPPSIWGGISRSRPGGPPLRQCGADPATLRPGGAPWWMDTEDSSSLNEVSWRAPGKTGHKGSANPRGPTQKEAEDHLPLARSNEGLNRGLLLSNLSPWILGRPESTV